MTSEPNIGGALPGVVLHVIEGESIQESLHVLIKAGTSE